MLPRCRWESVLEMGVVAVVKIKAATDWLAHLMTVPGKIL